MFQCLGHPGILNCHVSPLQDSFSYVLLTQFYVLPEVNLLVTLWMSVHLVALGQAP